MLADSLNSLLPGLQEHPGLALLVVFAVALAESLFIVGMILPGAAFMVGFGALIALQALPAGATVLAATLGAIAGDGLSYWLGWHYKEALKSRWPFRTRPEMLSRGENFFRRHGGKSVLLGRFIGPLRPVVPAIAGMLAMPPSRFLLANVASACLWAPLYLLPGYLFGLSVDMASEFAGRFLLVLALLAVLVGSLIFLLRQCFLWLVPHLDRLFQRLLLWSRDWNREHPLAGEIPAAILNPQHREIRGLSLLALILLSSSALLLALYEALETPLFSNTGLLLQNALFELRNPPATRLLDLLARLGEPAAALPVAAVVLLWQWRQGAAQRLALLHLLAVPTLPLLLMLLPQGQPPLFSGELILSLSIYGFLLIALARHLRPRARQHLYAGGASLMLLILFARVYLGSASLLQAGIETCLIGLWVSALGIAYRRHASPAPPARLSVGLLAALVLLPLASLPFIPPAAQTAAGPPAPRFLSQADWLARGWQQLDDARRDLRDARRFPLNLQWAAPLAAIRQQLQARGWRVARRDGAVWFNWLRKDAPLDELPVPPHVHRGRYESLAMFRYRKGDSRMQVLRLWPTAIRIRRANGQSLPLWLGSLSAMEAGERFGLRYLRTRADLPPPDLFRALLADLPGSVLQLRQRQGERRETVLLLLQSGK